MGVTRLRSQLVFLLMLLPLSGLNWAITLPKDHAEATYHYYDGGGVEVTGPALFVRKSVADSVSVSASYYVDEISSASIDVKSYASPYEDERTEYSVSADYIEKDAKISIAYVNSDESDYQSDTYHFDYVEEFFGGLTTASLGYSSGSDTVLSNISDFSDTADHDFYRLGLSQVVLPEMVIRANYEHISDTGFLGSPYRKSVINGVLFDENLPRTRRSNAFSVGADYFIETWSTAIKAQYRYFSDTWDIKADDFRLSATKSLQTHWIIEGWVRYYGQSSASFYQDQFSSVFTYRSRDKELSDFDSYSLGLGVEYLFQDISWLKTPSLAFGAEWIRYQYNDFYEYQGGDFNQNNNKQLYEFDATVAYVSFSTNF
ncbi:DUF3570 domain-containing protein [Litoribrevibacter albus]|uniref:DUF3570 domain-containing protein n=1 Tax=Litoribrevibacter albus TaxID=1473156 RepID=A0AA37S813_9GAMM|nr:DUF3570 domain-containing protein [Litoribrevibacter albus]GLQ30050.1 hypothetical protein GCM10007876_05280 [Litoribrevibacter albus]